MTTSKFILQGGNTSNPDTNNDKFFAEFGKEDGKVLMCYFSRSREDWEKLLERDTTRILKKTVIKN